MLKIEGPLQRGWSGQHVAPEPQLADRSAGWSVVQSVRATQTPSCTFWFSKCYFFSYSNSTTNRLSEVGTEPSCLKEFCSEGWGVLDSFWHKQCGADRWLQDPHPYQTNKSPPAYIPGQYPEVWRESNSICANVVSDALSWIKHGLVLTPDQMGFQRTGLSESRTSSAGVWNHQTEQLLRSLMNKTNIKPTTAEPKG